MPRHAAVLNLVYAQLGFFGFLLICIVITTSVFHANHGLSFYGEHIKTLVPYALAIFSASFFIFRAGGVIAKMPKPFRTTSIILMIVAFFLLANLFTPDTINSVFNTAHDIVGAMLFFIELGLTGWLMLYCYKDWLACGLFIAQLVGFLIAAFSQLHIIYYLSEGSLIFQLAFGLVLIRQVSLLLRQKT